MIHRAFVMSGFAFLATLAQGAEPKLREGEVFHIGTLAKEIGQHPIEAIPGEEEQDYLDAVIDGKPVGQVILIFKKGAESPKDRDRRIEVVGKLKKIDLGGPEGTKNSYKGETIHVRTWRYLDKATEAPIRIAYQGNPFGQIALEGKTLGELPA